MITNESMMITAIWLKAYMEATNGILDNQGNKGKDD